MEAKKDYYNIYKSSLGSYDCFVICLSYESIYSYISTLQNELSNNIDHKGNVLIDQLLITGNKNNRFLSLTFNNGSFVFTSAKNVDAEYYYHQITSAVLKRDETLLNNSILSKKQISMILRGCVI